MGGCMSRKPTKIATRMEYIRSMARTGDIWLFISDSCEIRCFTGSPYTHIGMIVVLDPAILGGSGVYLWHSMPPGPHYPVDLLSKVARRKGGPQLNDIADVLERWGDVLIDVRRIRLDTVHPWAGGTAEAVDKLLAFMRKEHTKKYETNFVEFVKSAYDGPGGLNTENTDEYFCSELIAETFMQFNIMNTPLPSNEFYPGNFSSREEYTLGIAPIARFRREMRIVDAV